MPSQLVNDVRALIAARHEAGSPPTALERTFILAALGKRTAAGDVVDELEEAITLGRRVLLTEPPAEAPADLVRARRREAATRLLAAARAVLDDDPFLDGYDPAAAAPDTDHGGRPERADLDR